VLFFGLVFPVVLPPLLEIFSANALDRLYCSEVLNFNFNADLKTLP